jgi:protein-arginine kinase activator protein McsA
MNSKSSAKKQKLRCDVCGKRFKKGATRYRINIEVISDFDGYIEDFSKKPQDYSEKKIGKIIKQTEEMTERELEEEIYLKRDWLMCVNCREEFVKLLKKFMGR